MVMLRQFTRVRTFASICLLLAHVPHAAQAAGLAGEAGSDLVQIDTGLLRGTATPESRSFLSIPYASPPVGALRWRPPQAPQPWQGERDARQQLPACPQPAQTGIARSETEDCLYLNVYTPPGALAGGGLPVLVFVHGGSNVSGSARDFDGRELSARTRAVVVTVNYRLGALGWLALPSLHDESPALNHGAQDVQAALQWVQRNATAFGGDPKRVTLSGESAGGVQVWTQMISPRAAGLFQRAIVQSANVVGPMSLTPTLEVAYPSGERYAHGLGCPAGPQQMACLRAKPVADIVDASKISDDFRTPGALWTMVIDKEIVPDWGYNLLKSGAFARVPLLVGANRDEGRLLVMLAFQMKTGKAPTEAEYQAALKSLTGAVGGSAGSAGAGLIGAFYTSRKYGSPNNALGAFLTDLLFACPTNTSVHAVAGKVPVYAYEFQDRTAPTADPAWSGPDQGGAYHSAELQYLFAGAPSAPPLTEAQKQLSIQMQRYWGNFVATGNPNTGPMDSLGLPNWPRFDGLTSPYRALKSGGGSGTLSWGAYANQHQCWFWSLIFGAPKPPVLPPQP